MRKVTKAEMKSAGCPNAVRVDYLLSGIQDLIEEAYGDDSVPHEFLAAAFMMLQTCNDECWDKDQPVKDYERAWTPNEERDRARAVLRQLGQRPQPAEVEAQ